MNYFRIRFNGELENYIVVAESPEKAIEIAFSKRGEESYYCVEAIPFKNEKIKEKEGAL